MEDKLRKIQLCQLEILKEVVRICDKHGIDYWLAYGTMLGAVRHKGFIPWDDDLDIYMTMEGFKKFQKICKKELASEYFLQTPRTERLTQWLFFKVRKNGTLMLEREQVVSEGAHRGVWIDIFPVINVSNNQKAKAVQIAVLRKLQRLRTRHLLIRDKKTFREYIKLIIDSAISLYECILWRIVLLLGGNTSNYKLVVENEFFPYKKNQAIENYIMPAEWFSESTKYVFEDGCYNGIKEFDRYLSHCYTENYMTPIKYRGHAADYSKVIV